MKRLLYLIAGGLLAVFTIGCSNTGETSEKDNAIVEKEHTNLTMDSLSMAFGDLFGAGLGQQLRDMDNEVDMNRVFKEIEFVANSDTSKHFIAGMQQGIQALQLFNGIEKEFGAPLNKQIFLKHMKDQFMKGDLNSASTMKEMQGLVNGLVDQFKSKASVDKTATMDSLSLALGTIFGGGIREQILSADSETDLEQAFKGFEYMAKADFNNDTSLTVLPMGLQVVQLFQAIKQQTGMSLNKDLFMKHLRKNLKKEIPQNEMEALQNKIEALMNRVIEQSPKAIANKKAGEAYMNKLKGNKDYIFTESGLAYKVIKSGLGKNFTDNDKVKIIYVGKHIDGTELDSSNGEPKTFDVKQVIPGFAEMLKLMKPGSKVVVVIPGDLAYGTIGMQPQIGPNETLIFEMETVGVK